MPELTQVFIVNHPRRVVWDKFQDLPKVVACIPGATLTDDFSATHAKGRMKVKLGPVRADFGGEVEIATDAATSTGRIAGTGIDKSNSSRAKGDVVYTLAEVKGGAATQVTVQVDYTLSGLLAQVARGGIVEAVAEQICRDFTENLEAELNAAAPRASVGAATGEAANQQQHGQEHLTRQPAGAGIGHNSSPARSPGATRELNMLGVLAKVLWRKLTALFGNR